MFSIYTADKIIVTAAITVNTTLYDAGLGRIYSAEH